MSPVHVSVKELREVRSPMMLNTCATDKWQVLILNESVVRVGTILAAVNPHCILLLQDKHRNTNTDKTTNTDTNTNRNTNHTASECCT